MKNRVVDYFKRTEMRILEFKIKKEKGFKAILVCIATKDDTNNYIKFCSSRLCYRCHLKDAMFDVLISGQIRGGMALFLKDEDMI